MPPTSEDTALAMIRMEAKLDTLVATVAEMKEGMQVARADAQQMALWRERVESRLNTGAEKMNRLERDQTKHEADQTEMLKGYIEKKAVWWFMLGAAVAGGSGATLLLKALGH